MTTTHARLTEGPVAGHLVSMTVPMVWAILGIMLFNATDTWFVAQLGAEPLAAMSFTFPVIMVCLLYTSPSPRDQRGSRMPSSA